MSRKFQCIISQTNPFKMKFLLLTNLFIFVCLPNPGDGKKSEPICFVQGKFLSVCLSVYLPIYLSICLSVYFYICLSVYLYICLSVYLSVCLSVCLSVYLSICLSVYISICLYFYLSICLFINLTCNHKTKLNYPNLRRIDR
jgi:hypothetical protein